MKTRIVLLFAALTFLSSAHAQDSHHSSIWTVTYPGIDLGSHIEIPKSLPLTESGSTNPEHFKVRVEGNIGPSITNTFNLGSNEMRWRDIFVGPHSLHIGNGPNDQATLSHSTSTSGVQRLEFDDDDDGDVDINFTGSGDIEFIGTLKPGNNAGQNADILRSNGSSSTPTWVNIQSLAWSKTGNSSTDTTQHFVGTTDNNGLVFRTNNVKRANFNNSTGDADSGAFAPYLDNTYSLGTSTHRWKDLYLGSTSLHIGGFISGSHGGQDPQTLDEATISYSNGAVVVNKAIKSAGSLSPNNNDLFTLGTSTDRWSDLYLAGNSLHIGTSAAEATMSYDDGATLLQFNTDGAASPEIYMGGTGGAGKLGVGAIPNTSLDVSGDAAFRFTGLTLTNGVNTGVSVGASSAARISGPSAAFELHGLAGGQNGKILELYNASGQTMRIANESASETTAANRIVTGTGASIEVRNMNGVSLAYNSTDNRWIVTSSSRNTSNATYSMKTYASFGGTNQTGWAPDLGYICHRISSSSNITMSGINSTGVQDGMMIVLLNVGSNTITLQNENTGAASATYRILTGTGNNEALSTNEPATLVYDATSQRWRMISGR